MRHLRLLLLLLLPLCLTGCWDRLEINDVAIVDLVGIDKAPNGAGLRLTVSVIVPSVAAPGKADGGSGGKSDQATVCYCAEGESIMNAMMKIQEKLSRRLFWAHARTLVIGEAYARGGVRPALDFWSRHREPRLRMQIAVTPGSAFEFVKAQPRLERLLSEQVRESINMHQQTEVSVKDFLGWLRSETEEPFAPRVSLKKHGAKSDVVVSGTAVFQDDRMLGWLSDGETRGLLWLRGEMQTGVATVNVPSGGKISMMLIHGTATIKPDFRSGRLRMKAHFEVEDDVYETSAAIDLGKQEAVEVVQELLRQDVVERVRLTIDVLQRRFGVDLLGFGDVVRRAAPRKWEGGLKKRWAEEFRRLPVDITVTTHVRRTGEHGAPLGTEDHKVKSNAKELLKPKE